MAHFLRRAAIIFLQWQVLEENKDRAKECGVAGSLVRFVPCSCEPLIVMTLRLLYNLSFDPDMRYARGSHTFVESETPN